MSGHEILLNIAGGVALLLWATRMIRTGILRAYGAELRRALGRATRNRLSACGTGLAVTMLVQSSTATALLATTFASRGLIMTAGGLAIMLGANIGSTVVVQVLSFDVSWLSPVLILLGVVMFLSSARPFWQHIGRVTIGLGLMLLSLSLIVDASETLRHSEILSTIITPLVNDPILALLLAAALTWLCHSNVAVVLLVMSFTVSQIVPMNLGLIMVLGANVGSGVVAFVLSLSESRSARRIPLGNLLFRATGALLLLPFIGLVLPYLSWLEAAPARQIANFNTLFNLGLAVFGLPWVGLMGKLTERLFPEDAEADDPARPKYLDSRVIGKPSEALSCAIREALRMADTVEIMLRGVIDVFPHKDVEQLAHLSKLDDEVDGLHEAIKRYVTQASLHCERAEDSERCAQILQFTTNLEHVGDIIDKNLLEIAQQKIDGKLAFSDAGWRELVAMHACVMQQMQLALSVFISREPELAEQLLAGKRRARVMEHRGNTQHLMRIQSQQVESLETSGLHLDILRDFKRIDSHLSSIAYAVLDEQRIEAGQKGSPEPALAKTASPRREAG